MPYDVNLRLTPVFRTQEPFLDYGVAEIALALVSNHFLLETLPQWTEVKFDYKINGVLVGRGSILKGIH